MDKPICRNPMEPFPLSDEYQIITERTPMNLQLFAGDPIDWRRVYETQPPEDPEDATTFTPTPIFKTPYENSTADPTVEDDLDDDEEVISEPIFMPRLSITDKNLSYFSNGEMVIADEEGNLSTASVDEDGALSTTPIQINGEMIQDESIPGSKMMENTITSRELDMEDLFSDSALLNQLVAANIDTDDLFLNDQFIEKLTDRIAAHPIDSLQIVDGAITRAKIEDAAIDLAKIDVANIDWASIANLVAEIATIAQAQITTANIREADIDWANIATLAAEIATIAQAQITTANIREADIDWANIATLVAEVASISKAQMTTANIENANIDWANITTLAAIVASLARAEITTANIEQANINWVAIGSLTTAIANIATARIENAQIDYAHIADLVTGTALIREGVNGKLFVDRLAVSSANIVELSVGALMIKGNDGKFYRLEVDEDGEVTTEVADVGEDNIADNTIPGTKIIEDSITARELNVSSIFADAALINAIKAANIDVADLFASEAYVNNLHTSLIQSDIGVSLDISSNESITLKVDKSMYEDDMDAIQDSLGDVNTTIQQARDSILLEVKDSLEDDYVKKTVLQASLDGITVTHQQAVSDVSSELNGYKSYVETYQRFSSDGIELGKKGGKFTALLSNEALEFCESGNAIASISNQKMIIKRAEVSDSLGIGTNDEDTGFFDLAMTPEGMGITWREA